MAWAWESTQVLIAVLAPLVGVPLGVITFYLRSLYENQLSRHAELVRRFELIERMGSELARTVAGFALDYTTKEEWLRECMYARGRIERLAEILAKNTRDASPDREIPATRESNLAEFSGDRTTPAPVTREKM